MATERNQMLRVFLLLTAVSFLTGCMHLDKEIKALAGDTNSLVVKITTPWGSAELYRNYKP